jgi:hypothetical protein
MLGRMLRSLSFRLDLDTKEWRRRVPPEYKPTIFQSLVFELALSTPDVDFPAQRPKWPHRNALPRRSIRAVRRTAYRHDIDPHRRFRLTLHRVTSVDNRSHVPGFGDGGEGDGNFGRMAARGRIRMSSCNEGSMISIKAHTKLFFGKCLRRRQLEVPGSAWQLVIDFLLVPWAPNRAASDVTSI